MSSFTKKKWVLLTVVAASLINFMTGCSTKESSETRKSELKTDPSSLLAVEAQLSLLADELRSVSDCVHASCKAGADNSLEVRKKRENCRVGARSLNGTSAVKWSAVNDLSGCATSSGPVAFQAWPPRTGSAEIEFQELSVKSKEGQSFTTTGHASLIFNGRPEIPLKNGFQTCSLQENGFSSGCIEIDPQSALTLTIDQALDGADRTFNGQLIARKTGNKTAKIFVDGVQFDSRCCHPVGGSIILDQTILKFEGPCGTARLEGDLGRWQIQKLSEC